MSQLYAQPLTTIIHELAGRIFENPETGQWETAEAYASGDVVTKLAHAERAYAQHPQRWQLNVQALRNAQPPAWT